MSTYVWMGWYVVLWYEKVRTPNQHSNLLRPYAKSQFIGSFFKDVDGTQWTAISRNSWFVKNTFAPTFLICMHRHVQAQLIFLCETQLQDLTEKHNLKQFDTHKTTLQNLDFLRFSDIISDDFSIHHRFLPDRGDDLNFRKINENCMKFIKWYTSRQLKHSWKLRKHFQNLQKNKFWTSLTLGKQRYRILDFKDFSWFWSFSLIYRRFPITIGDDRGFHQIYMQSVSEII